MYHFLHLDEKLSYFLINHWKVGYIYEIWLDNLEPYCSTTICRLGLGRIKQCAGCKGDREVGEYIGEKDQL